MSRWDWTPRLPHESVDPECCRASVSGGRFPDHQCSRRPLPGERYCRQHSDAEVTRRRAAQEEKYRAESEKNARRYLATRLGFVVLEAGVEDVEELRRLLREAKP